MEEIIQDIDSLHVTSYIKEEEKKNEKTARNKVGNPEQYPLNWIRKKET